MVCYKAVNEKVKEREEAKEMPGQTECKVIIVLYYSQFEVMFTSFFIFLFFLYAMFSTGNQFHDSSNAALDPQALVPFFD